MSYISLPTVLDAAAKASVILALTAVVAVSLRRASAAARHFVWTLGLLSALAVPALSLTLPRWELPIVRVRALAAPAARPSDAPAVRDRDSATTGPGSAPAPGRAERPGARSTTDAGAAAQITTANGTAIVSMPWRAMLLLLWLGGAALVLGRMFLGLAAVLWMSRRTPAVTDAPWLAQARALAGSLGLSRVRFLQTAASTMPMAWGIFRSSVLMPADADTWPAHRLRVVLLHELAHVKRRDCLTHLVAQIACAAYWFNPLAWMAARRLRTERERACDDLVLAAGTRGSDYADQLLDIARVTRAGRFPAVLAGASLAMAHRSQLEGRLMAILDPSVPRRGLTRARALASAVVFALLIVPVASVQPWAEERWASAASTDPAAGALAQGPDLVVAQKAGPASQAPRPDAPIESYPGQAAADNRRNAARQDVIQDQVQGAVQGSVQGAVQGTIQGAVQGTIQGAVQGTIQGAMQGHVQDGLGRGVSAGTGIAGAVVSSVVDGVVDGVASGIAAGVTDTVAAVVPRALGAGAGNQGTNEKIRARDSEKGHQRDPRTVNALMEALKDTDRDVRETAMQALVQMRDPRMFDPLVAALKDSSADVREQAAFGLGQLRDARAVDPLAAVLKDQNPSVREQAVFALGQLRAASVAEAIASALHDTSADVREQAAFALGQIGDKKAVEPLISALKDANPSVREQAAFALGQMRDPRSVEPLVIALKDQNPSVREQAAFALGQIGDARAIDGLTVALKDANPSVRQQAAFALGQIR